MKRIVLNEYLSIEIDPKEIKLLDLNARYMRHEEFKQLVDNIQPHFCVKSRTENIVV